MTQQGIQCTGYFTLDKFVWVTELAEALKAYFGSRLGLRVHSNFGFHEYEIWITNEENTETIYLHGESTVESRIGGRITEFYLTTSSDFDVVASKTPLEELMAQAEERNSKIGSTIRSLFN